MASVRDKPYGTFEVMYRDPAGRQRSRTFKRKTDANRFAQAVETDKARGEFVDPRLARATVGHYADEWWDTLDVRPKTRQVYEGHLRNWVLPQFANVPVACQGGTSSAVSDMFRHHIRVSSAGKFHAIQSANGGRATYKLEGRFRGVHKAIGTLRVVGTVTACSSADSGVVHFSATPAAPGT